MFALTKSMSYYLCPGSVDMRGGIYSLYQIVKSQMKRNPLSEEVFIFLGKNRRCIKILHWEKDGFLLYHKKLRKAHTSYP
jgi:transposase